MPGAVTSPSSRPSITSRLLDPANYRAIEKLRDGRNYIIRAQRRDDNIIDALHLRAGLRTFYLRFLTRKHRLNNLEASFYLNVDFITQVALLADLHGEIVGGARYYIWSPGQADIAFIVGDAYQNKGIASAMLHHLAFIARSAGISELHAHTLPDNRRALRVLDKLGFPCTAANKRNMMHVTLHLGSTAHPESSQT
jgi:RimJ/RimL family protein N-acetyltransferase